MLWEHHCTSPTKTTMPVAQFYPLLANQLLFDSWDLTRNFSNAPGGTEFVVMCPVWWRLDILSRVRVELIGDIGDIDVARNAMQLINLHPQWDNRAAAMLAIVEAAECEAGTQSPYLLANLGVVRSVEPTIILWSRKSFGKNLAMACYCSYPK